MLLRLTYNIKDVAPYINWPYFDYAWGVGSGGRDERERLRHEAMSMLEEISDKYRTHTVFGLFSANSDGDDILIESETEPTGVSPSAPVRVPFLRQQHKRGSHNLCLSDFIRPRSLGVSDRIGVFAATIDHAIEKDYHSDPYRKMMAQTLADRLAEATAEKMHEAVRKHYWGYAKDENLSIQQLHIEAFQGIRPAVGYPSLPDTGINFIIDRLIGMKDIGIRLTENGMMMPHASVSGFMISHPRARYFDIGKIGEDQLRDYARRRGIPVEMAKRFLAANL